MRGEVAEAVVRFLLALDDHRWGRVEAALDETVSRDYTSLFGGEPDAIAGSALVAEWRAVLTGLDAHQHLTGPAVVELNDDEASADVHVVATHVLDGDPGSPWVIGGTYRLALRHREGHWRIAAIKLDTRWQTGDAAILERAHDRRLAANAGEKEGRRRDTAART
jgi:SnoaL-like domain